MPKLIEASLIDARGLRCPWPVLRVAKALRRGNAGGVITIVADDPIAQSELSAFALEHGLVCTLIETSLGTGFQLAPKWTEA